MLELLRRSKKGFSEGDFENFFEDVRKTPLSDLLRCISKKERVSSKGGYKSKDEFVARLDAIRKSSGMKSADAVVALRRAIFEHDPHIKLAIRASFAVTAALIRDRLGEALAESILRQAADAYAKKYSVKYDLS